MSNEAQLCRGEVDDLLALEEGLSPWEIDFLDSINNQLAAGRALTPKQLATVHKIWDRNCA